MGKIWPSVVALLGIIATGLSGTVQGMISHHPVVSAVLALLYSILAHWLPSPLPVSRQ